MATAINHSHATPGAHTVIDVSVEGSSAPTQWRSNALSDADMEMVEATNMQGGAEADKSRDDDEYENDDDKFSEGGNLPVPLFFSTTRFISDNSLG